METQVQYRDCKGAYCAYYPRSMDALTRRLKWLRSQRKEAAVYRNRRQVGAVCSDSAAPGRWTWWCEGDLFETVA